MISTRVAPLLAIAWGLLLIFVTLPGGGPFTGLDDDLCGAFCWADRTSHYVAAIAAMHDPIDWSQPLAIASLRPPIGTSLLLTDALPLLSLPLRLLWQVGLEIDPALAMDLWVNAMVLVAPLLLYRIARLIGGGPWSSLAGALLVAALPGFLGWIYSGVQGLASWPLILLLIESLLRDEADPRRRGAGAALFGALLWWASPYLGAAAAVLIGCSALRALLLRRRAAFVALAGSLAGLVTLRLADIRPPSGFEISSSDGYTTSSLAGLFTLHFEVFAQFASAQWGLWALLFFLLAQRFWWRRSPSLLLGAWLLAVLSLGSESVVPGTAGGPFPNELIMATPFADLRSIDRLFFVAAIIGALPIPLIAARQLDEGGRSLRRTAVALALAGISILSFVGSNAYLYSLQRSNRLIAAVDDRAVVPVRALIAEHERLLFLPDALCSDPDASADFLRAAWFSQGQAVGLAWASVLEGVPAHSFFVGRLLVSGPGHHTRPECAHVRNLPPNGTLVAVSTLVEQIDHPAPWRAIVASMARCTERIEIGVVRDVRFCSAQPETIERFEEALGRLSPAP